MRKKQANVYFPDKKFKDPPYLTKEEIKDFESEFTLFEQEIDLQKLKESMINQNYHNTYKPVFNFVDKVLQEKNKINFSQYMGRMTQDISSLNQGQLIIQMLDEQNKGQISKQTLKEVLEQALGRQILPLQMNEIMLKLFDSNNDKITTESLKRVANYKIHNMK